MNAILGFSRRLLDEPLTEKQHRKVGFVNDAAQELLGLIDGILDLSRIEAGKMELGTESFDFEILIRGAVEMAEALARDKGLAVDCLLNEDVPRNVRGDGGRLRQILNNLLSNAVKFTEEGGVSLRVMLESQSERAAQLRFEVTDSGIGIPANNHENIFEVFSQADGSATRRHGGTGLGLAICRKLVHLMGGTIGVESEVGQGSTFHFTVELEKQQAAPRSPAGLLANRPVSRERGPMNVKRPSSPPENSPQDPPTGGGPRILYAEDAKLNQLLVKELLKDIELDCDTVASGKEAVAAINANSYDLVLMDVEMPDMDGLEATRHIRLREQRTNKHIPIIGVTAHAMQGDRERCCKAGMDDYLPTPLTQAALLTAIGRYITLDEKQVNEHGKSFVSSISH